MADGSPRFPGYDVLAKRNTPSWNEPTLEAVQQRLEIPPDRHEFFNAAEWRTLRAVCDRILPQPADRADPVPIAAMIDRKMARNQTDGTQKLPLPEMREAWRRGLGALDDESRLRFGAAFHELAAGRQDDVLSFVQTNEVRSPQWKDLPAKEFFSTRILHDVVNAYYAHPTAWNEIGFGGPASPRGYVRLGFDMRDSWEAAERDGRS